MKAALTRFCCATYRETAYGWWVLLGTTALFSYAFRDENAAKGIIVGVFFGAPSMLAFSFGRSFGMKMAAPRIVVYLAAFLLGLLSDGALWLFKLELISLCIPLALLGTALGELSRSTRDT